MNPAPSPAELAELEGRLRHALRLRAAATPSADQPVPDLHVLESPRTEGPTPRPWRRRVAVAGAVAAAAAAVIALAQVAPSTHDSVDTTPAGPTAPTLPDAEVPRLLIDGAPLRLSEGEGASPVTVDQTKIRQSFRRPGRLDGPMIFVTTLRPFDPGTFGLVSEDTGDPLQVRGRTGFVSHYNGEHGATTMSVELGDGDAIYVIAIGLADDELVEFVDGLRPGPDGTWIDTVAPRGVSEVVAAPPPADGRYYGGRFELPGVTSVDVNLYQDGFESRLADRVGATVAPVEMLDIDGHPSALGSYSDTDWWLLLEPEPGRAQELRIAGDRATVDQVLSRARFVDEVTWDAAVSGP